MDIEKLLTDKDISKLIAEVRKSRPIFKTEPDAARCQYNVSGHDVNDRDKRKDKIIYKDVGTDPSTGEAKTAASIAPVARVAVPFQELIVTRRVGFMLTNPIEYEITNPGTTDDPGVKLLSEIRAIESRNKMSYKNRELARRLMSEMEVAELWYVVKKENKFDLRVSILSPELGDKMYPVFDRTGDMIAFGREYTLTESGKGVDHFDLYTKDYEYKYLHTAQGWAEAGEPINNIFGKIMIIYYQQPHPEWARVQGMIDRLESLLSNHADMNDYYGSPMLKVKGDIRGFAQKGEQGKVLQLEGESDADYLALASEPSSMKMEKEELVNMIYAMSQTPDISFNNLKGMGATSGIALALMFVDAHMAASVKEEIFGIGVQRRINLLKNAVGKLLNTKLAADSVLISPVFTPYLPGSINEIIENLQLAVDSRILSRESAVRQNPLVQDVESELLKLREEEDGDLTMDGQIER